VAAETAGPRLRRPRTRLRSPGQCSAHFGQRGFGWHRQSRVYQHHAVRAGNSADCQTIDNVLIDTGSSGLRILSSALRASLALPQQIDGNGDPLVECAHFADGYTWGPVKLADFRIAGEQANALTIQVIGDPQFSAVPGRCSRTGPPKTPYSSCAPTEYSGWPYSARTAAPLARPAADPVSITPARHRAACRSRFLWASNCKIRCRCLPATTMASSSKLPSVPEAGAVSASGSLVFGIGTQANNAIGGATVIGVDAGTANFTTVLDGNTYSASFIDSGSNAFFFADAGMPVCTDPAAAGFYCPPRRKTFPPPLRAGTASPRRSISAWAMRLRW